MTCKPQVWEQYNSRFIPQKLSYARLLTDIPSWDLRDDTTRILRSLGVNREPFSLTIYFLDIFLDEYQLEMLVVKKSSGAGNCLSQGFGDRFPIMVGYLVVTFRREIGMRDVLVPCLRETVLCVL